MKSSARSLYFSDSFVISCGTVAVDLAKSKVLLIRSRGTKECYLPKGRKNIGESLEDAAERETYEETSFRVKLLPVPISTLATAPDRRCEEAECQAITEPLAVTQRLTGKAQKIIFWFVAVADSATSPEDHTQQEGEDFDTIWASFGEFESILTFEDDRQIARKGIAVARSSAGLACGS